MWRNCHEKKEISIHVPLRGGRLHNDFVDVWDDQFQSTSPYAGDDPAPFRHRSGRHYFNPRPPTRGTTCWTYNSKRAFSISIHVPLRGGRPDGLNEHDYDRWISIHVPLRGGRPYNKHTDINTDIFQSTSPYAGDDGFFLLCLVVYLYFNPRPPTRGTTPKKEIDQKQFEFQSTSPYAGDDNRQRCLSLTQQYFNPRPPTRGTT